MPEEKNRILISESNTALVRNRGVPSVSGMETIKSRSRNESISLARQAAVLQRKSKYSQPVGLAIYEGQFRVSRWSRGYARSEIADQRNS